MNLNSLSDVDLIQTVKVKAQKERELTLEILNLICEIQRRKIYLARGYSSLHAFCVEELKYSDAAAQRRIQSMRLLKEIPEAEVSIKEGRLNLTTVSMMQSFFVSQAKVDKKLPMTEKRELLLSMEGKSKREAEKVLIKINPEFIPKEKERVLSEDKTEIKFIADERLLIKLKKLRALMSHKNPDFSYSELIEELADQALKKLDKAKVTPPAESEQSVSKRAVLQTRYIPAKVKRQVWYRDAGRCQYVDSKSGRQCNSEHFIQIDHIQPFSQNGTSKDPQNLRLMCGQHNRWRYLNALNQTL